MAQDTCALISTDCCSWPEPPLSRDFRQIEWRLGAVGYAMLVLNEAILDDMQCQVR